MVRLRPWRNVPQHTHCHVELSQYIAILNFCRHVALQTYIAWLIHKLQIIFTHRIIHVCYIDTVHCQTLIMKIDYKAWSILVRLRNDNVANVHLTCPINGWTNTSSLRESSAAVEHHRKYRPKSDPSAASRTRSNLAQYIAMSPGLFASQTLLPRATASCTHESAQLIVEYAWTLTFMYIIYAQ